MSGIEEHEDEIRTLASLVMEQVDGAGGGVAVNALARCLASCLVQVEDEGDEVVEEACEAVRALCSEMRAYWALEQVGVDGEGMHLLALPDGPGEA